MGKGLTDTLSQLAKWVQETDRLPGGDQDEPLDLDAADWTLVAAMMAPAETRIVEGVSQSLDLSDTEAEELLNRIREAALKLTVEERPKLTRALVR